MAKKKKFTGFYPAGATSVDRKAKDVKLHNQVSDFSKNVGDKTKIRDERVVIRDTKTGKVYGVRTLAGKATNEHVDIPLMREVLKEDEGLTKFDIETALPLATVAEIKSNIRKGAKDITQDWANALELVQKAYQVAQVMRPSPEMKEAWQQYEECIQFAVRQLARTRGLDGKWRMTSLGLKNRDS